MSAAWDEWAGKLTSQSRARQSHLDVMSLAAAPAWHVLVVDEEEETPQIHAFVTIEALRQFLMTLEGDVWTKSFFGWPAEYSEHIPGSDLRYLIKPDGASVPLFDMPDTLAVSSSGYGGAGPGRLRLSTPAPDDAGELVGEQERRDTP